MATEKQIALVKKLAAERNLNSLFAAQVAAVDGFTVRDASRLIDGLLALQTKRRDDSQAEPESGMYTDGKNIFKVYRGQSGRMLAKELIRLSTELTDGEYTPIDFVYRGMAHRFIEGMRRMSLEDAREFGAIYGVCCNCGRTLTDETSIEAGIGPVCARRFV